ncbi:MAG: hypothetical protein K9N51_12630 [Candidatus Pacebacteria bacterium]|nr:hypothetical protein [Candidatus Paceibacterota bacterium]
MKRIVWKTWLGALVALRFALGCGSGAVAAASVGGTVTGGRGQRGCVPHGSGRESPVAPERHE